MNDYELIEKIHELSKNDFKISCAKRVLVNLKNYIEGARKIEDARKPEHQGNEKLILDHIEFMVNQVMSELQ